MIIEPLPGHGPAEPDPVEAHPDAEGWYPAGPGRIDAGHDEPDHHGSGYDGLSRTGQDGIEQTDAEPYDTDEGDDEPPSLTSFGQAAIGDHTTMVQVVLQSEKRVDILRSLRTPKHLQTVALRHVVSDGFDSDQVDLTTHRVICLLGPAGNGRRTHADMLLRQLVDNERVAGIERIDTETDLASLAGAADFLPPGHGVVLEAGIEEVRPGVLDSLSTRARLLDSYLVLLIDHDGATPADLRPYARTYLPPPPENVLARHLHGILMEKGCVGDCLSCTGGCRWKFVDHCLRNEQIVAELRRRPRPADVVELAAALADWDGSRARLDAVLAPLRTDPRELARQLLFGGGSHAPGRAPQRVDPPASQLARLLFHDRLESDVLIATELLTQLMPQREAAYFPPGSHPPLPVGTVDRELVVEVLNLAWQDVGSLRDVLTRWLDRLVGHRRGAIRRRAADLAGLLAQRDFDEVYYRLIRRWAVSERARTRQAAAWALEQAAGDRWSIARVRGRVRGWVDSSSPRLAETAARLLGTGYGALDPERSLLTLRRLAGRVDWRGSLAVPRALNALHRRDPELVISGLADWLTDKDLRVRVVAVRSFVDVVGDVVDITDVDTETHVGRVDGFPAGQLPCPDQPDQAVERLATLWRAAMSHPATMQRAWKELRLNLLKADVGRGGSIVRIAERILSGPDPRNRFYLDIWAQQEPDSPTLQRLRRLIDQEHTARVGDSS
jgi:hypothetical protein